jgi:hypothetical protein
MQPRVKFTVSAPGADRIHHISEGDVRIVLNRLPFEVWCRLRAVHFNDRGFVRACGYVSRGRREITLCALPPRMSLTRALVQGPTPEQFGARWGRKWPLLAIRRFLLYDVFLHELGHLQLIDKNARSERLKFAHEKLAHEFAAEWRSCLWSQPFAHPDPVHNSPSREELDVLYRFEEKAPRGRPSIAWGSTPGKPERGWR